MGDVDDRHADVTAHLADHQPTIRVEFDDRGDITGGFADARPMAVDGRYVATPWGGNFSDYATLDGMRMPTRAEAYWDLPEARFVYWRAQITSAERI
jgi:hypothetical protein